MAKQGTGQNFRFVDDPSVRETFIDSLQQLVFDGTTLRITLCVTRIDDPKPPKPPSGVKRVSARLVLTPNAAADLYNSLSKMIEAMEKDGVIKKAHPQPIGSIH